VAVVAAGTLCVVPCAAAGQGATMPAPRPAFAVGERVSAEDLLAEFAYRTGIIVVKTDTIPGEITVTQAIPENPEKAVAALNEMLGPLGFHAAHTKNITSTRLSVRILREADARKEELANGPVTLGNDPRKIDVSERGRMVTHILPVNNPELLETLRKTAGEQKDVTATVAGSSREGLRLILAGPALSVRGVVERAATLDPAPPPPATAGPAMVRSIQLKQLEAQGSAAILNEQYGRDANGKEVLRALADPRTNSIVISGQELDVLRALQLLQRMDAELPAPQLPPVEVPAPRMQIPPSAPTPANPATLPGR
jgi:hypothetical protein